LSKSCQKLDVILENKVVYKLKFSKNVNKKIFAPEIIYVNENKQKDSDVWQGARRAGAHCGTNKRTATEESLRTYCSIPYTGHMTHPTTAISTFIQNLKSTTFSCTVCTSFVNWTFKGVVTQS
jgi:hypothetical protein